MKGLGEVREDVKVLEQLILEVAHAQSSGPEWYTKGSKGLYQQVSLWLGRGSAATARINKVLDEIDGQD